MQLMQTAGNQLHESKFPLVSRIKFLRSTLPIFSAHVSGVYVSVSIFGFSRSCLLVTSGARSAERVLWIKGEISVCAARPDPTRPDPTRPDSITLLRSLYLWNGLIDSRAVFFVRCHHSINFVFDRSRYPRCLPRHVARAGERVFKTPSPSVTPQRLARLRSNLVCD